MDKETNKVEQVIRKEIIKFEMEVQSKEEAIYQLGETLLKEGRITNIDIFVQDVLDREKIESTNMDIGVAIPHGASDAITQNSIAIGRLKNPIQWEKDEEKQEVRVIFLMAICSENRDRTHLELLSKIATLLLKEKFLNTLFNTNEEQEIIDQIQSLLQE